MRFGICCDGNRISLVAEAGYEYVETAFNKFVSMKRADITEESA